ncbi:MAG: DUF2306 domain-containing protein [Reichenbachiella sp.]|uniref:DUF2306 domain-containing protein n=1 Tax=Reichenbachiella sp. TaxID=2184521 RepID=UPI0032983F3A
MMKKIGWVVFGFFSIGIYPILYGLVDMSQGFLGGKTEEVLNSSAWNWFFYQHIGFGAISMLSGWTQFSKRIRAKNINIHRTLGKIYVGSVILSGMAGLYLSFFATGGVIAAFGFGAMALAWLGTTVMAFITVKKGQIEAHQNWMIRSYAVCWAAVTLRLWLPILQGGIGMDFISAYLLVSWLSWVPNLMVAEWIVYETK